MPSATAYSPIPAARAVINQLSAELAAHRISGAALAERLDRDPNTIRRYLRGERQLGVDELLAALDVLDLSYDVFMHRASERLAAQPVLHMEGTTLG